MKETGLVQYDDMVRRIEAVHSVDEVVDLRDKARALEVYAQQAMNTEAERKACEIRLRAERKAGQMLAEKERGTGTRGQLSGKTSSGRASVNRPEEQPSDYAQAKQSANITDTQAKRWQKLAKVSEPEFESALGDPEKKPSTSFIIKKASGETTKMDETALWLWGRVREFERRGVADKHPAYLLSEMTDTQIADMRRLAGVVGEYLLQISEEANK